MTRITFGNWLRQAVVLIVRAPLVWAGYTLFIGILFSIGRVSLALGVFLSVTCLFVGVRVAKYIDLKSSAETSVSFYWVVRRSLPLAVLAASSIVLCWFVFRIVANIYSGEIYKISQFFFYWDIWSENLDDKSMHQIAGWIYSSAMVTLLFVLLMLTIFASWFSYPLMLFKNYSWSQAKERGTKASSENDAAMYKLLAFVFAAVLIGAGVMPLLTPVLYMLVSTLMYVSYKAVFESTRS
ncbi:MAG: hypothetical protein WC685_11840 [Methylobacter sp.]